MYAAARICPAYSSTSFFLSVFSTRAASLVAANRSPNQSAASSLSQAADPPAPIRHLPSPQSNHDLPDRPAVVDVQPLAAGHLQPPRVEAEQLHDRGVDVGDVVAVL